MLLLRSEDDANDGAVQIRMQKSRKMTVLLKKQYHKKDEFKRVGESEWPKIRYSPSLP